MTPAHKKLMIFVSLAVVGAALLALVFTTFNESLVYFYTPTELKAKSERLVGSKIRIGGMVKEGSLVREPNSLKIRFVVVDESNSIPVNYEGMVPDLFREGQGVVAEGVWEPGKPFAAGTILAKHSEDYVPVEMSSAGVSKAKESIMKSLR